MQGELIMHLLLKTKVQDSLSQVKPNNHSSISLSQTSMHKKKKPQKLFSTFGVSSLPSVKTSP